MRFSGKKEITFAWYTNVISYVVRHQGQSCFASLLLNDQKLRFRCLFRTFFANFIPKKVDSDAEALCLRLQRHSCSKRDFFRRGEATKRATELFIIRSIVEFASTTKPSQCSSPCRLFTTKKNKDTI